MDIRFHFFENVSMSEQTSEKVSELTETCVRNFFFNVSIAQGRKHNTDTSQINKKTLTILCCQSTSQYLYNDILSKMAFI